MTFAVGHTLASAVAARVRMSAVTMTTPRLMARNLEFGFMGPPSRLGSRRPGACSLPRTELYVSTPCLVFKGGPAPGTCMDSASAPLNARLPPCFRRLHEACTPTFAHHETRAPRRG